MTEQENLIALLELWANRLTDGGYTVPADVMRGAIDEIKRLQNIADESTE